ncbi:MAG: hypothetical protein HY094_07355 [Candidatus Melainabacteria bacterium]|nr:hypothetical protein [Candidatus Melainabacteria bacterium]
MSLATKLLGYLPTRFFKNQIDPSKLRRYDVVKHPKYGKGIICDPTKDKKDEFFVEFPDDPTSELKFHIFRNRPSLLHQSINELEQVCSREDELKRKYGLDLENLGPLELANIINSPTYEENEEVREIVLDKLSEYGENLPKEVIQIIKSVLEKDPYSFDHGICGFLSAVKVAGSSKNEEFIPVLKNIFEKELDQRSKASIVDIHIPSLVLIETTGALAKIGEKSKAASDVLLNCLKDLIKKMQEEIQVPSLSGPYVDTAKGIVKVLSEHEISGTVENGKKAAMATYINEQAKSLDKLYKWSFSKPDIDHLKRDLYAAEETPRLEKIWLILQNPDKYPISQEQREKLINYGNRQRDYFHSHVPTFVDISRLREGIDEVNEICKMVK